MALRDYFRCYSLPRYVISDRGYCFTSTDFRDFLRKNDISHILIVTDSLQENGQFVANPMVAKIADPQRGIFWDNVLEHVEYCLNNTVHRSVGEYPSVMLIGLTQRGKMIDSFRECLLDATDSVREKL